MEVVFVRIDFFRWQEAVSPSFEEWTGLQVIENAGGDLFHIKGRLEALRLSLHVDIRDTGGENHSLQTARGSRELR